MNEIKFDKFEEQVFLSTLRIERPGSQSMGTGFLVKVDSFKEGQSYIFLVSNKHVIDDPKKETRLVFHTQSDTGAPLLGDTFKVNITQFLKGYYAHPNPEVDIALLNISEFFGLAKEHQKNIMYRNLTLNLFANYEEIELTAGQKIVFVGYPDDRYDKKNFLPILRGGYIASIPKIDYEGRPHILIDAQVFPGSSGSPVFAQLSNKFIFIGVVCQTMIKGQKVQIIETASQMYTENVLGIGIVIKSQCVKELVEIAQKDLNAINGFI